MTEPTETHPDHTAAHARKRGFLARLRGSFLTGLVVISPIGLSGEILTGAELDALSDAELADRIDILRFGGFLVKRIAFTEPRV